MKEKKNIVKDVIKSWEKENKKECFIMAKRGDSARQSVTKTIADAFGTNFVGIQDKKIYVQAEDGLNGEVIQFAISITMPKVPVTISNNMVKGESKTQIITPTELSPEDQAKVKELMEKLGVE